MGKRAAVAASVASKVAKQPKVQKDPFEEEISPLIAFLGSAGLSEECHEMLSLAAPHAFRTYREDRHKFQDGIVEKIAELISQANDKLTEALARSEAECAAVAQEQGSLTEELARQQGVVDEKLQRSKELEGGHKEAANRLKAAAEDLAQARAAVDAHAEADKTREAEKQSYEAATTELWEPLKAGVKDINERKKKVTDILKLFGKCGTPTSLMQSLGVALKMNADKRGEFTVITIEHGEKTLAGHIEKLAAEQGSSESDAAALASAVSAAEDKVKEEEDAKANAMTVAASASDEWAEEMKNLGTIKAKLSSSGPRTKALAKALEEATAKLAGHTALMSQFEALRDRQAPAPATEDTGVAAPAVEATAES